MDTANFGIRVECNTAQPGEAEPRRFWLGQQPVEVADIVDRWVSPEHRYFKLRSEESDTYILRHDALANRWELTLFERRPDWLARLVSHLH